MQAPTPSSIGSTQMMVVSVAAWPKRSLRRISSDSSPGMQKKPSVSAI